MEIPDGKLSTEQQQKLLSWLNDKGAPDPCPVCHGSQWEMGGHLLQGVIHTPGVGMTIGGGSYPLAFISCARCAHVRTFLARPIGLT